MGSSKPWRMPHFAQQGVPLICRRIHHIIEGDAL